VTGKAAGHPANSARFGLSQHRTQPCPFAARVSHIRHLHPTTSTVSHHIYVGRGSPRADLGTRSSVTVAEFLKRCPPARFEGSTLRRTFTYPSGTRLVVDFYERATMGTPTARGCCEEPALSHGATVPQRPSGNPMTHALPKRDTHCAVAVACHGTHPVSNESRPVCHLTAARAR
jgi:hypothetical protein